MIRMTLFAIAAFLATSTASADDDHCRYTANCDYEIRERLLTVPIWVLEVRRANRLMTSGVVRFEQRGAKLIALADYGMKCENEVTFVPGGFMCGCIDPVKYVQVDDAYQSIRGNDIITLRPR